MWFLEAAYISLRVLYPVLVDMHDCTAWHVLNIFEGIFEKGKLLLVVSRVLPALLRYCVILLLFYSKGWIILNLIQNWFHACT